MSSLIPQDHHWALWAVLLCVATLGLWAERTRWGARLSGAVMAIILASLLTNMGVIPVSAPAYDMVWSYLVPLAIPLLLFRADIRRIWREAGPTLIAFGVGAVGTVIGTVVAYQALPLGEEGWKLAGIFAATYIGGSMNYVATAETLGLRSSDLLTAGVAADSLVMSLYFLLLFAIPSMGFLRRRFPSRQENQARASESSHLNRETVTPLDMSMAVTVSAVLCAIGFGLESMFGISGAGILIITALVVGLATAFPSHMGRLTSAERIGILLMQIFFATIGASANAIVVLRVGPILFVFASLILAVHLLILLIAGKLLQLDLREIVIASNANMGGPTTAAAMAVARRWEALVLPAILCGTLGYAVATFIGATLGNLLR